MATVVKNGITMAYSGTEGNSSVSVSAIPNQGLDYSESFTVSTTNGELSHDVVVNLEGRREVFISDLIFSDGQTINTIKDKYKDE